MAQPQTNKGKRIEYAPSIFGLGASPGVISVLLGDDEDVQWCWTHYPDGRSAVTGYEIIRKDREEREEEGFSFEEAVTELLWPDKKDKGDDLKAGRAPDKARKRTRKRAGFLSSKSEPAG